MNRDKMNRVPVVYVAGPFRAPTAWGIEQNVRRAEEVGAQLAQAGFFPLIPHANTRFFQGIAPDALWLQGTQQLLRMCDAVTMVSGWTSSEGSMAELKLAQSLQIPVVYAGLGSFLEELRALLQ